MPGSPMLSGFFLTSLFSVAIGFDEFRFRCGENKQPVSLMMTVPTTNYDFEIDTMRDMTCELCQMMTVLVSETFDRRLTSLGPEEYGRVTTAIEDASTAGVVCASRTSTFHEMWKKTDCALHPIDLQNECHTIIKGRANEIVDYLEELTEKANFKELMSIPFDAMNKKLCTDFCVAPGLWKKADHILNRAYRSTRSDQISRSLAESADMEPTKDNSLLMSIMNVGQTPDAGKSSDLASEYDVVEIHYNVTLPNGFCLGHSFSLPDLKPQQKIVKYVSPSFKKMFDEMTVGMTASFLIPPWIAKTMTEQELYINSWDDILLAATVHVYDAYSKKECTAEKDCDWDQLEEAGIRNALEASRLMSMYETGDANAAMGDDGGKGDEFYEFGDDGDGGDFADGFAEMMAEMEGMEGGEGEAQNTPIYVTPDAAEEASSENTEGEATKKGKVPKKGKIPKKVVRVSSSESSDGYGNPEMEAFWNSLGTYV